MVLLLLVLAGGFFVYTNPNLKKAVLNVATPDAVSEKVKTKAEAKEIVKDEAALTALAQKSMQDFSEALKKKDMTTFYNTLSAFWKERTSVETLNKDFAFYIQSSMDLTVLKGAKPVLLKGTGINKRDDLQIVGQYVVKDAIIHFGQGYRFEGTEGWKLVEFSLNIQGK